MIQALTSYCDERFIVSDERCDNCINQCQGGCEQCLDAIHFSRVDRPYNCSNIVYFYTNKYCYKYSSEIDILMSKLKSLKHYDSFDVLSIGCGPCTELVGVHRCMNRSGYNKPLTYVAFEMNKIWEPVHSFYKQYFSNDGPNRLRISYTDACQSIPRLNLDALEWRPNILILQYVLSDMNKAKMPIRTFIDSLMDNVISHMPLFSYVIINDINHWKARQWFDYLETKFSDKYKVWRYKGHFSNNNRKAYEYGTLHPSNRLSCTIDRTIGVKYNPWNFCSSAHLVLKKRGMR